MWGLGSEPCSSSSVVFFFCFLAHVFIEIATFCLKCLIITMNWFVRKRKRKDEKEISALAGNRTRVNCLEGSYAHHYTTNASMWDEGQFLVNEYILRITWIGLRNSEKQSAGPWNRTTNIKEFSGRFFSFAIAKPPFQGFLHLNLMNYPWKSKNIKVKKKNFISSFLHLFTYSGILFSPFC